MIKTQENKWTVSTPYAAIEILQITGTHRVYARFYDNKSDSPQCEISYDISQTQDLINALTEAREMAL